MGTLRAGSMLKLTSSIFMKRVRQLVYGNVYRDSKYKGRRMANLISILTMAWPKLYGQHPWLKPRPVLDEKVRAAVKMGTTLWFNDEVRFEPLAEVGEASVCFVLLKHLIEDRPGFEVPGTPMNDLFQTLKGEWSSLNAA